MKNLLSYSRSMFWIIGVITILMALLAMVSLIQSADAHPGHAVFYAVLTAFLLAVGIGTCLGARALKKQGRFARTLVAFASLYSLVIFPLGTIAGAFGLYWCFSPRARTIEPLVEAIDYQPKKGDGTYTWVQAAISVLSVVIGLGSLGLAGWWGQKHGLPSEAAVNGVGVVLIAEWISIFFHELGHAIAGWMVDMKLAAFSIWPLTAHKVDGRWKLEFRFILGGSAASVPLHLRNLRRRMAFEVAGGPIASLLTAAAGMAVLSVMPGSRWVMWWKVPAVVAAVSAGAVVLNLIPFRSVAGFSDGAVLVQLLCGGAFADMREVGKMIATTTVTATRPRDLDAAALARAASAPQPDSRTVAIMRMLQLICAVDRGDLASARDCLDAVLQRIPSPDKESDPGVRFEIGFFLAYLDGNSGRAARWIRDSEAFLGKKKLSLSDDFAYWLSLAAVRLAEARMDEADAALRHAKDLSDRLPHAGLYDYNRDLLIAVKERSWLRLPEPTPSETLHGEATPNEATPSEAILSPSAAAI